MHTAANALIGREHPNPILGDVFADTPLMAAFGRWLEAMRHLDVSNIVERGAAADRSDDLIREIAEMPALSHSGFAVKAYLMLHCLCGGVAGDAAAVDMEALEGNIEAPLLRSIQADVLRVLPALRKE